MDFYPSNRNIPIKTSLEWLRSKRKDDICGDLWRIDDSLYDLEKFEDKHPGGTDWIRLTKGTDITEAFHSMHVFGVDSKLLRKYFVKKASTPRNYRHSFREDGFFKTLQKRARPILSATGTGPDWRSKLIQDILTVSFLILLFLTCRKQSLVLSLLTGILLGMQTSCAHNWFHLRDSQGWRRFFFDLSLLSHRDWRISHALSHHLYTNTLSDIEVTAVEPFMSFLPEKKGWILRNLSPIYLHLMFFLAVPVEFIKRFIQVLSGAQTLLPENILPVLEFALLLSSMDLFTAFKFWFIIHGLAGYWLIITSVTTTHHHPELYHAGDTPRLDSDWGLHQVDTVRDLEKPWLPLVLTTFGDHLLHHLFPAVDHSRLPLLYPALYQTLAEFQVSYPTRSLPDMVEGLNLQLRKTEPTDRSNN